MSRPRRYVLKVQHYTRLVLHRNPLVCKGCDSCLFVGDEVVSKPGGNGLRKIYCVECAKKYGVI